MPDEHDPPMTLQYHLTDVQLKLDYGVRKDGKYGYCLVEAVSVTDDLRPRTALMLVLALRMVNTRLREEFGVDGVATLQQPYRPDELVGH